MKGKISGFRIALAEGRKEKQRNREQSLRSEVIHLRNRVKQLETENRFLSDRLEVDNAEENLIDPGTLE